MDDIREWHIGVAILTAATIHAVSATLYLSLVRPISAPQFPPPPLVIRMTPPAPPAQPRGEIPTVAMPRAAPVPALPTVPLPEREETPPAVEPEALPAPQLPDLTPFELPKAVSGPVPVPRARPAVPDTSADDVPRAPMEAAGAPSTARQPRQKQWTPAEKAIELQKYFANDPRWGVGVVDPTAPITFPELYGEASNVFADHGPAPGSVDPTAPITFPELYGEASNIFADHGPIPGSVDPSAPITMPELYGGNGANIFANTEPLTTQEVEEAWRKISGGQATPPPPEFWEKMRRSPLENWVRGLFSSSKESGVEPEKAKAAPAPAPSETVTTPADASASPAAASGAIPYE